MPYGPGTYGSQVGRPKKKNKKLSPKQKMIARQAGDSMKIEAADFKMLRKRRGMNDPRYERDTAYRNDIMRKLELSDIDF